jgi:hypothetical protein
LPCLPRSKGRSSDDDPGGGHPAGQRVIDALHVSGPAGEHAGKLMLFGQFVGSWDLKWAGTGTDGEPATATGELHFGWVLGGRAVQDIWIVPGRGVSRFHDPVLRPLYRRLAFHLGRTRQRPGAAVRRPARRR